MNELNENNFVTFFLEMPEERQLIWLKTMHKEEEELFYSCVEKLLFLELSSAVKARIIGLYTHICQQKSGLEYSGFRRQLYFFSQSPDYQLKLAAKSAIGLLKNGAKRPKNTKKSLTFNQVNNIPGNSFQKSGVAILLGLSLLVFTGISGLTQKNTAIIEFKPSSTFVPYAAKNSIPAPAGEYKEKISLSTVAATGAVQKNEPELKTGSESKIGSETSLKYEQKTAAETDPSKPVIIPEFSKVIVWDIGEKAVKHKLITEAKQNIKPESEIEDKIFARQSVDLKQNISEKLKTVAEPESDLKLKPTVKTEVKAEPLKKPLKRAVNQNVSFLDMKPGLERQLVMNELAELPLGKDGNKLQISSRMLDEPAECQLLFVHDKLQKTECLIKIAQRDPDFPLQGWGEILRHKLAEEGLKIQAKSNHSWSAETSGSKYLLQLSESVFHGTRIFTAELKSEAVHK
jgi:hypothetical protein